MAPHRHHARPALGTTGAEERGTRGGQKLSEAREDAAVKTATFPPAPSGTRASSPAPSLQSQRKAGLLSIPRITHL